LGIVLLVFSSFFGWQGILYTKDLIALYLPIMLCSIQTWRVFFFFPRHCSTTLIVWV
jgi:hypothetical protein